MRTSSVLSSVVGVMALVAMVGCGQLASDGESSENAIHVSCPQDPSANPDGGMMMEEPPTSEAVDPINFDAVYVVNGGDGMDGSISVINASTNTLARTIPLMGAMWPHHIYMSADRRRLAVAVPGMDLSMGHEMEEQDHPGAAMILDARTGATLASVLLPNMNHNVVFSPNQREVWTSQMMEEGMVLVLDATTLATLQEIPVGMMPAEVTMAPEGNQAWVANSMSNDVTVINPSTKAILATIGVGETPILPSQGSNGFVYVDNEASQTVSALRRSHLHVDVTFNLGFMPGMAKLGPDNRLWVTDADNGKVVQFEALRDRRLRDVRVQEGAHALDFSTDGRRAYVSNQMAASVSVIDVATLRVIRTICVGTKPNGVLFRRRTF